MTSSPHSEVRHSEVAGNTDRHLRVGNRFIDPKRTSFFFSPPNHALVIVVPVLFSVDHALWAGSPDLFKPNPNPSC